MAREIPEAVRAVAGLAATVLDEARKLPESLPGLPVRVLGMAMQLSMRLQQHYAGLVARGDELFTGLHGEDEPGLATFDDEDLVETPGFRDSAFDRALRVEASAEVLEEFAIDEMVEDRPITEDAGAVENALLESDRAEMEAAAEPAKQPARKAAKKAAKRAAKKAAPPAAEPAAAEPAAAETPAQVHDTAGDAEASARAARAASIVVHGGEIAVDDALGSGDGEQSASTATAPTPTAPTAPATPPVEGYDDLSVAQLRGRLRGYAAPTVQQLLAYEEAGQSREPYLRMLRNRLEKLAGS